MREGYGTCVYFVFLFYNLLLESLFALQTSHIFSSHEGQGFLLKMLCLERFCVIWVAIVRSFSNVE